MVSLLDNAASGGLLADPRPAILAQLFDMSVKRRPTILPMFTQQNGRIGLTAPQLLVDAVNSAMLPFAAAQGYRATPTDVSKMAMDTMLGGGLLGRAPSGSLAVNVFHGTPHKFAPEPGFPYGRPRLDKMGTGEGAQAYGPGFYSAETPGVAKSYKDNVAPQSLREADEDTIAYDVSQYSGDDIAEHAADRAVSVNFRGSDGTDYVFEDGSFYRIGNNEPEVYGQNIGTAYQASQGTLYKLDIPDADAAKTLDWDAPLSEQPKHIKKAWADFKKSELGILADESLNGNISAGRANYSNPTGKDIYGAFVEGAATKVGPGKWAEKADYDLAVKTLREAGIPGVKYLDQGSRGAGEGSRNYSIWDQDVLDRTKMLERDGVTLGANKSRAAAATGLLGRTPAELRSEFDKNVFHGTRDDFLEFEKGDLGFHFGTPEQASNRLQQTRNIFGVSGENIIPAKIKIKNPLSLPDLGEWNDPAVVAMGIIERGGAFGKKHQETLQQISDEASEIKSQFADMDDWKASYEAETLLDEIRMLMQKDGYDGVKYKNEAENKFGDRGGFTVEGQKAYNELNKEHHELRKAIALRRPPPPAAGASKVEVEQWLKSSEPKPTVAEAKRLDNIEKEKAKLEETETYSPFSYIVFDPSNIRSRFAAFDPENAESANILAANAAPLGLLSVSEY